MNVTYPLSHIAGESNRLSHESSDCSTPLLKRFMTWYWHYAESQLCIWTCRTKHRYIKCLRVRSLQIKSLFIAGIMISYAKDTMQMQQGASFFLITSSSDGCIKMFRWCVTHCDFVLHWYTVYILVFPDQACSTAVTISQCLLSLIRNLSLFLKHLTSCEFFWLIFMANSITISFSWLSSVK